MTDSDVLIRWTKRYTKEIRAVDHEGTCLVGSSHDERAIAGHVVPKSRLALIAERWGKKRQAVRTFTMDDEMLHARAAGKLLPVWDEPSVGCVNIDNRRLRSRFACAPHDGDLFAPVDGPTLDPSDPRHGALISYRTLLYFEREALSYVEALGRVEGTAEFRALSSAHKGSALVRRDGARHQARVCRGAHSALWGDLQSRRGLGGASAFVHRSLFVPGHARVAFACVLWPGQGPFVLTCYPAGDGHVVVTSCSRRLAARLPEIVPAFAEGRGDRHESLTATVLDAPTEHIMIRPSTWEAYEEALRRSMWSRAVSRADPTLDDLRYGVIAPVNFFA